MENIHLLSNVACTYGHYRIENLQKCNGCWSTKTDFFDTKIDNKYYYKNYIDKKLNTRHVVWNNRKVCINCLCIGNRLYAIKYFLNNIIKKIDENILLIFNNNINFLRDYNNFIKLSQIKLSRLSLQNIKLNKVYEILIECYKHFFKNLNIIINSINKFIYDNESDYNNQYNCMKRLLECSSYKK